MSNCGTANNSAQYIATGLVSRREPIATTTALSNSASQKLCARKVMSVTANQRLRRRAKSAAVIRRAVIGLAMTTKLSPAIARM